MSRSGYSEDLDNWELIRWRGMVASATRGKRGQLFFKNLVSALESMPDKKLISSALESNEGVCAMGALAQHQKIDVKNIDPMQSDQVASLFDIAPCLAQEVAYENDEVYWSETPEHRWSRMYRWAKENIRSPLEEKEK